MGWDPEGLRTSRRASGNGEVRRGTGLLAQTEPEGKAALAQRAESGYAPNGRWAVRLEGIRLMAP